MYTRRVLERAFRHLGRICLLLLLPLVVGVGVAFTFPRSYQVTAGLKALQRYTVINTAGVAEANNDETPAQTQVDALNDDLTSPDFDLAVAQGTGLIQQAQASVGTTPDAVKDAVSGDLSTHVRVVATGTNHYTITYTNRYADVALAVVKAVIAQWTVQGPAFAVLAGKKLLDDEQAQLVIDNNTLTAALSAQKAYAAAHPGSTSANDPTYAVLVDNTTQAHNAVTSEQAAIDNLQAALTQFGSSTTLFEVADAPALPYRAVSRTKTLALGAGVGLLVGLLMSTLYLTLLVRRDRATYSDADLVGAGIALPIVLTLPRLSRSAAAASHRLLLQEPAAPPMSGRRRQ